MKTLVIKVTREYGCINVFPYYFDSLKDARNFKNKEYKQYVGCDTNSEDRKCYSNEFESGYRDYTTEIIWRVFPLCSIKSRGM